MSQPSTCHCQERRRPRRGNPQGTRGRPGLGRSRIVAAASLPRIPAAGSRRFCNRARSRDCFAALAMTTSGVRTSAGQRAYLCHCEERRPAATRQSPRYAPAPPIYRIRISFLYIFPNLVHLVLSFSSFPQSKIQNPKSKMSRSSTCHCEERRRPRRGNPQGT